VVKKYIPERGDFIWLDFTPQKGREQNKTRPAIVISPKIYNKLSSLVLVCPVTSKKKGWGFEIDVSENEKIKGVILADQIKSLDYKARNAKFIIKSPDSVINDTLEKIQTLLD